MKKNHYRRSVFLRRLPVRWGRWKGRRWWGCKQMLVARFSLLEGGGVRWLSYRKVKYPGWRRAILKKHMMQVPGLRYIGFLTRRLNCPPPRKRKQNWIVTNTKQLTNLVLHENLIATSARRSTINKTINQTKIHEYPMNGPIHLPINGVGNRFMQLLTG